MRFFLVNCEKVFNFAAQSTKGHFMEKVTVLSSDQLYNSFLDPKYIPAGQNKYYLRNTRD